MKNLLGPAAVAALMLASACGGSNSHVQSLIPATGISRGVTELVIADQCNVPGTGGSILRFPVTATGNVAPTAALIGPPAGGQAVAVDASDRAWVIDSHPGDPPGFLLYADVSGTMPAPVSEITGSATTIGGVDGLFISPTGSLYSADDDYKAVDAWAPGASGNVAPVESIVGSATGFQNPSDVALDSSGNIWVADFGSSKISKFTAGATGNVAPIAAISVASSLGGVSHVAIDAHDNVWITTTGNPAAVYMFANGATGAATPSITITGSATQMRSPAGIKVDKVGNIYVADDYLGAVFVFAAGASGNVAPAQTITGSNTQLLCPTGVALH